MEDVIIWEFLWKVFFFLCLSVLPTALLIMLLDNKDK